MIAGGASVGANASLRAAEEPDAPIDAVIWLAGVLTGSGYDFRRADVSQVECPLLIITAKADSYGASPDVARQLESWATAPTELLILDSDQHGTDIFAGGGANARELSTTMLRFVERIADAPRRGC